VYLSPVRLPAHAAAEDAMITEPGLYVMSLEEYLADPCPEPSLNHSLAVPLLQQSPWHAFHAHPRLCPEGIARVSNDAFDLGTVVHELVLEGDDRIWEVHAADWRTKDAKQQREEARAAGQIPLLTAQVQKARAMAAAVTRQVDDFVAPVPLRNGLAERVVIWREGAIWCRARIDFIHTDFKTIDDLKTTGASAHPADWTRTLFDAGLDLQVAFHCRGVQKVTGTRPDFRFLVVEDEPPYALSLIGLAPEALDFAEHRMLTAIELWARCRRTGEWPGYARRPAYADLPPWVQTRWQDRVYYAGGQP
jgi:PDDEXK-like domain of unknown function (DUF3799)